MFLLLASLVAASAAVLAGTAAYHRLPHGDAPVALKALLYQLDLAKENVLASWFSSMLLLLTAQAALVCFAAKAQAREHGVTHWGWAALASAFAILSLDELGSIHERVAVHRALLGWILLMWPLFLAIPLYFFAFAWFQLRSHKRAFLLLCAGVVTLSSVPAQEYLEYLERVGRIDGGRPLPYILLEEGCELLGMLLCLAALCLYALTLAAEADRAHRGAYLIRFPLRAVAIPIIAAALVIALMLGASGFFSIARTDEQMGSITNWTMSAAAAVAAMLLFQRWGSRHWGRTRTAAYLAGGVLSLLLSAALGIDLHQRSGPTLTAPVTLPSG